MSLFLLPVSTVRKLQGLLSLFWWSNKRTGGRTIHWLQWESLCVPRKCGGLGFRDLEAFNFALLGKQAWLLISCPDSLAACTIRAKYFPNGEFLKARLGYNPSFTWRNIWSSQPILREGCRWKIGTGTEVNIWFDPWLLGGVNFLPRLPTYPFNINLRVSSIINGETNSWDLTIASQILHPLDIQLLEKMPPKVTTLQDRIVWQLNNSGAYSVKSAYGTIMNTRWNNQQHFVQGNWKAIWELHLPPKIKVFACAVARNVLPTKANLFYRYVIEQQVCSFCNTHVENAMHVLVACPSAEAVWKLFNLWDILDPLLVQSDTMQDLMFTFQDRYPQLLHLLVTVLWGIWYRRNKWIMESIHFNDMQLMMLLKSLSADWVLASNKVLADVSPANNQGNNPNPACKIIWHPPFQGYYKFNVDASFMEGSSQGGLGISIRDQEGQFVKWRTIYLDHASSTLDLEALGLFYAIEWSLSLDMQQVLFETDSQVLINQIMLHSVSIMEVGDIIQRIRQSASLFPEWSFRWVPRSANSTAHQLACRVAQERLTTTFHNVPSFISSSLSISCNNSCPFNVYLRPPGL